MPKKHGIFWLLALQMMVLLSGALRSSCTGNKLQALEGWVLLLKALAQHAPFHLGGMANQVCLMPHASCLPSCGRAVWFGRAIARPMPLQKIRVMYATAQASHPMDC